MKVKLKIVKAAFTNSSHTMIFAEVNNVPTIIPVHDTNPLYLEIEKQEITPKSYKNSYKPPKE